MLIVALIIEADILTVAYNSMQLKSLVIGVGQLYYEFFSYVIWEERWKMNQLKICSHLFIFALEKGILSGLFVTEKQADIFYTQDAFIVINLLRNNI